MNQRKTPCKLIGVTLCLGIFTILLIFLSVYIEKTAKDPDGLEAILVFFTLLGLFTATIISASVTTARFMFSETSKN